MKTQYLPFISIFFYTLFINSSTSFGQCTTTIDVSDTSPCGLENVMFSVPIPNPAYTYLWNFGDPTAEINNPTVNSNTAMGTPVTHAFTPPAVGMQDYTITLTILEDDVACNTISVSVSVSAAPNAILISENEVDFAHCVILGINNPYTFDFSADSMGTIDGTSYTIDWGGR